jgi:hypothetical protein
MQENKMKLTSKNYTNSIQINEHKICSGHEQLQLAAVCYNISGITTVTVRPWFRSAEM